MKEGIVGKLAGDRYNQNTLHACGKLQTIKKQYTYRARKEK